MYDVELENIKYQVQNERAIIESIPNVAGTGITHTIITGAGEGYHPIVFLETYNIDTIEAIAQSINGIYSNNELHTLSGIPITFKVTGKWEILPSCNCTQKSGSGVFVSKYRPIKGGATIANSNVCNPSSDLCPTGTLAGFPFDSNGRQVLLSNNHVLSMNFNPPWYYKGSKGDSIIQPGFRDGGNTDTDVIATLENSIEIKMDGSPNTVDAGYAIINNGIQFNETDLCNTNISGKKSVEPIIGMKVKKAGRTTGCTTGTITALDVSGSVQYYPGGLAYFVDQVRIDLPLNSGDSGSLIVTENNEPVCLLYSSGPQCKIKNVEQALGLTFGLMGTSPSPSPPPSTCGTGLWNGCTYNIPNKYIIMSSGALLLLMIIKK